MLYFIFLLFICITIGNPSVSHAQALPGSTIKDCVICPELVVVPGGKFLQGSPPSELPQLRGSDEGPQRTVTVRIFAAGKYEVTQGEYLSVMGSLPLSSISHPRHPVFNVSWNDASMFIKKLNSATGLNYRLLSEAEWEYAMRAGTNTMFYTGSYISTAQSNFIGDFYYWKKYTGRDEGPTLGRVAPVGNYPPNQFGLHDMG